MQTVGSQLRNEDGQGMVEFAVVLPFLLALLLAIVQCAVAFNHYLRLTDAVRAGTRDAAVTAAADDPCSVATNDIQDRLSGATVSTCTANSAARGAQFTVTATYPYSIKVLGFALGSGNLTSSSTERKEG
jgi:Flp pilus assembly protein TadG